VDASLIKMTSSFGGKYFVFISAGKENHATLLGKDTLYQQ